MATSSGAVGATPVISGEVVISTCNRLEVYLDTDRFHEGVDLVVDAVARTSGLDREMDGEIRGGPAPGRGASGSVSTVEVCRVESGSLSPSRRPVPRSC